MVASLYSGSVGLIPSAANTAGVMFGLLGIGGLLATYVKRTY